MLYAADGKWWAAQKGAPGFVGLKLTQDVEACTRYLDVHLVAIRQNTGILTAKPGVIGSGGPEGGNSGFQAINLAVQFGARRIVLVGFDMRLDCGPHWHGQHRNGLNNPKPKNMIRWRHMLDAASVDFDALGVTVFNASPVSLLSAYPIVKLEDVYERADSHLCRLFPQQ